MVYHEKIGTAAVVYI